MSFTYLVKQATIPFWLCAHGILFARIGCIFRGEKAFNYAQITPRITQNTRVCIDSVYFFTCVF